MALTATGSTELILLKPLTLWTPRVSDREMSMSSKQMTIYALQPKRFLLARVLPADLLRFPRQTIYLTITENLKLFVSSLSTIFTI